MSKKIKQTKKTGRQASKNQPSDKTPFIKTQIVYQSLAIIMVFAAILIFVGRFASGWGGFLPNQLAKLVGIFGWVGWLVIPVLLVYFAILRFKLAEDADFPWLKLVLALLLVVFMSGSAHVFLSPEVAYDLAKESQHGGIIGYWISKPFINLSNSVIAFILMSLIAFVNFFFLVGITPKSFFNFVVGLFKDKPKTKSDDQIELEPAEGIALQPEPAIEAVSNGFKKLKSAAAPAESKKKSLGKVPLTSPVDPDWVLPSLDLLDKNHTQADGGDVKTNANIIRETLANFNIDVEMERASIGPRVTQYTLKPPSGIKLTKITSLENNIALDLAASSIRIEAPIPGKRAVGIEVPNKKPALVKLGSVLHSDKWLEAISDKSKNLAFCLGVSITGEPVIEKLDKMPHLLIAGQTGSGKSVAINTFLASLLYHKSPSELKMILVDPKQVELSLYNDIPHLLTPVIVESEKCISALKWAVAEMERRLRVFASVSKRNIEEYNNLDDQESMPFIVIVIDELADLMMVAARDVEVLVVRIAQKARAAGIHLVLATQRPSVDIITGLIKANVPARLAFTVASQVDSRTILDQIGAEKLLGQGDGLYINSQILKAKRFQGAFISEKETSKICDFIKKQRQPEYDSEVIAQAVQLPKSASSSILGGDSGGAEDELFQQAVDIVVEAGKASTSLLQRRLRIGYARAARLIESLEEQGIIGPADGSRPREVLVNDSSLAELEADELLEEGDDEEDYDAEQP